MHTVSWLLHFGFITWHSVPFCCKYKISDQYNIWWSEELIDICPIQGVDIPVQVCLLGLFMTGPIPGGWYTKGQWVNQKGVDIPEGSVYQRGIYRRQVNHRLGMYTNPFNIGPGIAPPNMGPGLPTHPLTTGYTNTYGWQAGATHPTGMFSC